MEDYLAARFISKPLRLLDCDYPVDAGAAVVIVSEERARDCRKTPVFVDSWAFGSPAVPDFYLLDDLDNSAPNVAASALWARTSLRPSDVDVCGLYDGQISHTLLWLEALGLCATGESGEFVRAGHTRLGGRLPTNCDGGAVNVGRVHGANHFIEVVRQLRGESGARQTPGAKVGVSANAIGMMAATAIMLTD
jgi:acetyl-CoA acetyltransferase